MQERVSSTNPRLELLRRKAEQTVLTLLRLHDWSAEITREVDGDDCIEIAARRGAVSTRIAVLYTTAISNASYRRLSNEVDRIFFTGQPYRLDSYAVGVTVPVEPLNDFFPFLVELNRQVEPDRSPPVLPLRPPTVRRLTSENPLDAVMARLRQFTSRTLARRLVEKRWDRRRHRRRPGVPSRDRTGNRQPPKRHRPPPGRATAAGSGSSMKTVPSRWRAAGSRPYQVDTGPSGLHLADRAPPVLNHIPQRRQGKVRLRSDVFQLFFIAC